MKKQLKKLNKEIYKTYIRTGVFRQSKYLRMMLNYREYQQRKRYLAQIPPDGHFDMATLDKDGYTFIRPDMDLFAELAEWCRNRADEMAEKEVRGGKKFFSDLLNKDDYRQDSILMRFALQEKVLNTVAKYIGNAPFLASYEVIRSQPYEQAGGPMQSQLWHTDSMDKRMIKIFVYIDPVEPENGPFTLMPASESRKLDSHFFDKKPYVTDEEMGRYPDLSRKVEIVGPPGTSALIDTTNCYHYGSRCAKPRLVFTAYYMSGFGFHDRHNPRYCFEWPNLPDLDLSKLSTVQKYALGFMDD